MDGVKFGWVCALVVVIGCGGGSGSGSKPAPTSATASVGAGGGSVSLAGGASVTVPSGALGTTVDVSVQRSSSAAPTGAITPIFSFGPDGTTFSAPVTVTFPVPAGTTAASVFWSVPGSPGAYESVPTTISGTTATAQVSHFSSGYVAAYDLSGSWAGQLDWTDTTSAGTTSGTVVVTHEVTQAGGTISYTESSSSGFTGTCSGTVSGTHLDTTCHASRADGCTISSTVSEEVRPGTTLARTVDLTSTLAGGPCDGSEIAFASLTKRSAPAIDVSGPWTGSLTFEDRDALGNLLFAGTFDIQRNPVQVGSFVTSAFSNTTGMAGTCDGVIVDDTWSYWCRGERVADGCILVAEGTSVFSGTPPTTQSFSESSVGFGACAGIFETVTGTLSR